jgi:hypothetical protein
MRTQPPTLLVPWLDTPEGKKYVCDGKTKPLNDLLLSIHALGYHGFLYQELRGQFLFTDTPKALLEEQIAEVFLAKQRLITVCTNMFDVGGLPRNMDVTGKEIVELVEELMQGSESDIQKLEDMKKDKEKEMREIEG